MGINSESHPSKRFRFCPACGAEGFSFDGEKLFTCTSCGFSYYINPAPAVVAIIESGEGRIVITRRKLEPRAGYLDLPGGFVDIMESAEEALRREVREELGIEIESPVFIGTFPNEYVYNGLSYFTCDLGFVCTSREVERIKPADDVSEAMLVRPGDIDMGLIGFPSIKNILSLYIKQKQAAKGQPVI